MISGPYPVPFPVPFPGSGCGCHDSGYGKLPPLTPGESALFTAALGAGVGALVAAGISENQISHESTVAKTVSWTAPTTDLVEIGKIPASTEGIGPSHLVGAYAPVNRLDGNGNVLTHVETQTFYGKGNPVVTYEVTPLRGKPSLDAEHPYTEVPIVRMLDQYGPDGHPVQVAHKIGSQFSANVHYQPQHFADGTASYTVPQVSFESGVNQGAEILTGVVVGAGLGALAGYLLSKGLQPPEGDPHRK